MAHFQLVTPEWDRALHLFDVLQKRDRFGERHHPYCIADLTRGLGRDIDLPPASPDMNRWVKCLETVRELWQLTASVNHARFVNSINTLREAKRPHRPLENESLVETEDTTGSKTRLYLEKDTEHPDRKKFEIDK